MANIERVDNQQNIALRQGVAVQADRGSVQQASRRSPLSLFYRDPGRASRSRSAGGGCGPCPAGAADAGRCSQQSLAQGPGAPARVPAARDSGVEKLVVEARRLAENQTLPGLDAQVVGNQDAGFGTSKPLRAAIGLDRQVLEAAARLPDARRSGATPAAACRPRNRN